ncbi:Meiotic recombination protein REC8 like [Dissostichus eleginoides]|uniref:Meiotic recombination protein REC8 like n=1 Tax=Dissostichus eleginoides TaxID=100907 RepID=A0AAD9BN16_DISEL|nr:Meiotic recombination protein REC8 like [Dissostichus eleginoides]
MFFYPEVLKRHTGCFSTVWLAATRGIKITRRELLKVNVGITCGDILDYVTAQVPPLQPTLPRPRFSLYLSSQLQYGVVVVYHRQCGYLLGEIQQTIDRLLRSKRCTYIDMAESDRLALDVPENLYIMEEAEGAQDPFFGLMSSHQLPSPYKTHQQMCVNGEAASQHSLLTGPNATLDHQGFRSPPAAISLKEKEPFVIPTAEYFEGDDLPEVTARELDLLLDQPDQFRRDTERQTGDQTNAREGGMSPFDQLKDTLLRAEQSSVWLLDQEAGHLADAPLSSVSREMTPPQVAMPTPPSGKLGTESSSTRVPLPRKPGGRRRRQLVFADPEVQISERAMKEQIVNPHAETLSMSEVLLDFPSVTKRAPPAQLFSAPCGALVNADLLSLWKHMREISSESGLQPADGSSALDVLMDMSRDDRSLTDVITPVSRWSPNMESQPQMEPIAEENIEMPEAQTDTEGRDMLNWISSLLQRFGEVTFDSLVSREANRATAAHTLYKLLELLSAGHVTIKQAEPYNHKIKLAADETQTLLEEEEADVEQANGEPAGRETPRGTMVRVELEWDLPMSVDLPIEVKPDPAHQPFPFLDTTLADLGIQESEVKERVVWVDTKKTQVKNKAGKLKEKEVTILEVRVKAQKPGEKQMQEVLYSTEAHTDRSFCRTGMNILPWKSGGTGENGLTPVQMTLAMDRENQQPEMTEAQEQREI